DGRIVPVVGIHPRRMTVPVDLDLDRDPSPSPSGATSDDGTPIRLLVEAASNPSFPQFAPSPDGRLASAPPGPRYRFRRAELVLTDVEIEALVHDIDVADGLMRALPLGDPRRAAMRAAIVAALDAFPDVAAARSAIAPVLAPWPPRPGGDARHRIVATGHAHIDTAWLWPLRETVRKCTRTFASAVDLARRDPDHVFSCSQAQQYAWIEERHPELFDEIAAAVERGQWEPVGGMWVEADMNLPSGESLARQIVIGQRWFESRFGRRSTEMWIPDVFGYPAGLPQLFAAGGMTRFVTQKLSWNKQNRFPHHTFWWEGLDGTCVLTHFPPVDTYNAEITPDEVVGSVERFRDAAWSRVSLMPFGYGDGGGGPTKEMLERARRMAAADPRITLEVGRPSDVFEAIEAEAFAGAPVPVWRGELYFETHRGTLTSQIRTKLGNRRCERLLVEAELWEATRAVDGREPLPHDDLTSLDELWREVLTQQFHDILPGSSIGWVHDDAEEVFERVEREVTERIRRTVVGLAPSGRAIVNPSHVHRREVITVAKQHVSDPAPDVLFQELGGDEIAIAVEVGPGSVEPLAPIDLHDRVVVTDSSMTNGHLAVRWDRQGRLCSVIDLAAQRELVPVGEPGAVLELARDQPVEYDAWDLESWTRSGGTPVGSGVVTVTANGPLLGRVEVRHAFGPSTATVTYELRSSERQLDVAIDLDWHHDEHLLSMAFPLDVHAPTASCDIQFGVVERPTHPSSPWDAAKFEVCGHRFVSVSEPTFGVAVLNDGRFGHGVFGGAIRVSLARASKYPDPEADHGRHLVRLALRPHDGDLGQVRSAAERLNRPLDIVSGAANDTPVRTPLVTLVGPDDEAVDHVEIDAVKLADDGSGDLVVRLHEHVGDRTPITVRASRRVVAASRCDLLEDPHTGEEVGDGVVLLRLRPFELVTLRLTLA
ncbi:MAG: glycoside hydrolase family 38 C-terminal domain-containing protein, partial [Actinomycetota bacterium]